MANTFRSHSIIARSQRRNSRQDCCLFLKTLPLNRKLPTKEAMELLAALLPGSRLFSFLIARDTCLGIVSSTVG